MLATYLVSQSKQFDEGVGGETRIVIVRENGAWIDDPQYIARFEEYIAEFIELIDQLFLTCLDVSIPPGTAFPAKLKDFADAVTRLRNEALTYSAARNLERTFNDPTYCGDPYSKIFPGAVTEFGTSGIKVREDTPEELEARTKVFELLRERSVVKQVPMP